MRIAFTGTQEGMTLTQMTVCEMILDTILSAGPEDEHHADHGGCIGSDEAMHYLLCARGFWVDVWRGDSPSKYGDIPTDNPRVNVHTTGETNLERNRTRIAKPGNKLLIATPKEHWEVTRSGTWATIRYAMRANVATAIVYPDGRVEYRR